MDYQSNHTKKLYCSEISRPSMHIAACPHNQSWPEWTLQFHFLFWTPGIQLHPANNSVFGLAASDKLITSAFTLHVVTIFHKMIIKTAAATTPPAIPIRTQKVESKPLVDFFGRGQTVVIFLNEHIADMYKLTQKQPTWLNSYLNTTADNPYWIVVFTIIETTWAVSQWSVI